MTVTGEIEGFSSDPHGRIDRILFVGGTNARAGKQISLETLALKAGDTMVTLASTGAVLALPTSPRAVHVPRVMAMLDVSSTILRVVHDRVGKIDTLVPQDGSIVKIPPTLREQADAPLSVGARISARGKGGIYGLVKAFRADRVQLASGQVSAEPERSPSDPAAKG